MIVKCNECGLVLKKCLSLGCVCPECGSSFWHRLDEEGLAFEIFETFNGKKVNVRKIYLNGHIEGFEGDPCVVNHVFPKMQALKFFAQNMNKEYRDLIRRCLLSDFYPMETLNGLYEKFKETIEKL